MGKLGKDLIESLRQAARLSVGKKVPKKIKQNCRSCGRAFRRTPFAGWCLEDRRARRGQRGPGRGV